MARDSWFSRSAADAEELPQSLMAPS
jgi:hypothetical protein